MHMRILVAHNRYRFSGGEDAVVRDEVALLRQHGHCVKLLQQDNDAIYGISGKLVAAASIFYSAHSRTRMRNAIRDYRPDIVHVHNWFPILSPSIIMEADVAAIPLVQTLHNYRMLCANALLYRDESICTDCIGKSLSLGGIVHGCYRNSRAGSAIVTSAYVFHRLMHTWDRVSLFIALSGFERDILVRGGLPAGKIVIKPNFVGADTWTAGRIPEDFALYVGRLSPEKGIGTLLTAWKSGTIPLRLKIIGDGPMADEVRTCAVSNADIEYMGSQPSDEAYRQMARAKFLVFPSEWFETFGRTVVEAFSQGTPVLASDLGSVRELVEEGVTGYRFLPGNVHALVDGAHRFSACVTYEQMRVNCRTLFLNKFTAEINYTLLMKIYAKAIADRMQSGHAH
jgi:glycosyltransferase involved in cell wall biosynthesis